MFFHVFVMLASNAAVKYKIVKTEGNQHKKSDSIMARLD